jgi:hypothetical protein
MDFTLPGLELRPLGRPALSQSLYRLHYPSSNLAYIPSSNRMRDELEIILKVIVAGVRLKALSKTTGHFSQNG